MTAVTILGWQAAGLRCPDHELDFRQSGEAVYPVSLIQMPNGTGKTTTLSLLRAALSGEASNWTTDAVLDLQKRGSESASGRFVLRLLVDERRTTVEMNFRFDEGRVTYSTTLPGGMRDGFNPPRGLERLFRRDFVRLYVFDGELAADLLDSQHTDAERAIEDLFLLRTFDHIKQRTTEYWQREVETRRLTATEERGLARRTNRLREIEQLLKLLQDQQRDVTREWEQLSAARDELAAKYRDELARHSEAQRQLAEAGARVEAAKSVRKDVVTRCLNLARNPASLSTALAAGMVQLKGSLDRARLPETAAREFFQDLLLEAECVCGRPMDEAARQQVALRRERYLGSDEVGLLNAIKSAIAEELEPAAAEPARRLDRALQELREASAAVAHAQTDYTALEATIVRGDPRLESARDDLNRFDSQLADLRRRLDKFDDPRDGNLPDEEVTGIEVLKRRHRDAEKKVAEISHTLALKRKRDILISILDEAKGRARRTLSEQICNDANRRIERLMPYNRIRLDRIERSLHLSGQSGGSVGETLSVGYAFLSTLFHTDGVQLPIVVDSPANPIDLAVRPEVAKLIPRLGSQFIGFTISSERQGFVEAIEATVPNEVQYLTLFRRDNDELVNAAENCTSPRVATSDGILVTGADFFNRFHADED